MQGNPCDSLQTLKDVVRCYIRCCRPVALEELQEFQNLTNLSEAVELAGTARTTDQKKFDHQWRIPNNTLMKFSKHLRTRLKRIKDSKDFESLRSVIHESGVEGIGRLTVYDTALRIGANLGFRPAHIYLHAGTTEGAKALGLYRGQEWLDPNEMPVEFRLLEPREIEDCLCIYKDDLKRIARTKLTIT